MFFFPSHFDCSISPDTHMIISPRENDSKMNNTESTPMTDSDFQHQLKISHDKQRQQLQEVRA